MTLWGEAIMKVLKALIPTICSCPRLVSPKFITNLSNKVILTDAISEKEMRWKLMLGLSSLFLTSTYLPHWRFLNSISLPPWQHWQSSGIFYNDSTLELDQNCSRKEFRFNLEQCPSCNRIIQKKTCRWSFLIPFKLFPQNWSISKLIDLFWRLLATWQWATCGCLCLLRQPKVSSSQHDLLWGDPGKRCCDILFLQQWLEYSTLPRDCPRQPMVGEVVRDCLLLRPAWPLPCRSPTSANAHQCNQHLSNALDTSVKMHPISTTSS